MMAIPKIATKVMTTGHDVFAGVLLGMDTPTLAALSLPVFNRTIPIS
jgi:hypothetical protein